MSHSQKTPPRFLPTLTEVVTPADAVRFGPVAAQAPGRPQPDAAAIVERVMRQLEPALEARLRELIASLVDQHFRALEPHLMQEAEQAMRASVAQAVAAELEAWPQNSGR